jgi:hypothetical protein
VNVIIQGESEEWEERKAPLNVGRKERGAEASVCGIRAEFCSPSLFAYHADHVLEWYIISF